MDENGIVSLTLPGGEHNVGAPGFWEGIIPVWGSGRAAINDFQTGHWAWRLFNSVLAVTDVFLIKSIVTGLGKVSVEAAAKTGTQVESKVFLVTKEGVVLPKGAKIPGEFVENKFRSSDFGEIINGKFQSKVRIDPPTPVNMKGPNVSHFHLNGGKEHIFDISRWPWW